MSLNFDRQPQPALHNFRLRNVRDAQIVAELAAHGQLTVAHRYLRKSEQSVVGPGQVWAIPTQQGKRWTDGLRSSNDPSSTKRGGFLCYPVPNPPAFLGAVPHASWIKKRATLKVADADGGEREWEIVAYDYDAQTMHGLDFRELAHDIDDLLLPAPMHTSTLNDSGDRAPSLTPFSPPASLIPASPSPSTNDPSSSLPSPQTPPPVHRWTSPSDSPLLQKQERQLFPRARTPHMPTRLAESTRWRPYARRRDPYDDKMLARLDSCPWPGRRYITYENTL